MRICFILTKHKSIYCKILGGFDVFYFDFFKCMKNLNYVGTLIIFFQIKVALSSHNPFFLEEYYFNFDYVMVTYKINE